MIELRDVSFRYPGASKLALNHVNLLIEAGAFALVCGATGSGKSTLLRSFNGLVPWHTGGTLTGAVSIDGNLVLDPRSQASTIGFVPQDPSSHSVAVSVDAEVQFALDNFGTEKRIARKRVVETLDALGVGHLMYRNLDTLSGGERQRVAIASVMVASPKVLLLDEPTSSLDPQSADDVIDVLSRLRDEFGITIVCSEHRLERVVPKASKIVVIDNAGCTQTDVRTGVGLLANAPPVTMLGRSMSGDETFLSVREARQRSRELVHKPVTARCATGDTVVKTRHLTHTFDRKSVLDDIDFEAFGGVVTAIAGRTGSGKTTLLRALAGLIKPTSGEIRIEGQTQKRRNSSGVAFLPQSAETLLYHPTVGDELGTTGGEWLRRVGLNCSLSTHPWDLSAGERLRLALAIVFSSDAKVFLLDEPTRGLDAQGRNILRELIEEKTDAGCAVCLVTHDVELIGTIAGRVALLSDGELIAEGPTDEIMGESLFFSTQTQKVMNDRRCLTPNHVQSVVSEALCK